MSKAKAMGWFKNLKKWQQGALIGCAVGLLIDLLVLLSFTLASYLELWGVVDAGWWLACLHSSLLVILLIAQAIIPVLPVALVVVALANIALYGGFGAITGSIQQVTNPLGRWLLTGLFALALSLFYWGNYQILRWIEIL